MDTSVAPNSVCRHIVLGIATIAGLKLKDLPVCSGLFEDRAAVDSLMFAKVKSIAIVEAVAPFDGKCRKKSFSVRGSSGFS